MKNNLTNYLSSVYRAEQELVDAKASLMTTSNKRYCDIPSDMTSEELEIFNQAIQDMGYSGLHVGLTSLWNKPDMHYISAIKKIGFGATHGTSVKWQLRTGRSYEEAVRNDKRTIDDLDPTEQIPLNYDLFAGNVSQTLSNNMDREHIKNAKLLMTALQLKKEKEGAFAVMRYIVQTVAQVFKDSKRTVVFEVPGTLGFSMFPNPNQFKQIHKLVISLFPGALFCVDVGHLLTWREAGLPLKKLINSLIPLRGSIRMIHISSAGSRNENFKRAYKIAFGEGIPDWHIHGLDLMLAVHEEEMLTVIHAIRNMESKSGLIEVCETRKPSAAIADYFGQTHKGEFDDSKYIMSLKLQSKLLGYC